MPDNSELKPCPFCGGELGVELVDNDDGTIYHSAKTTQCPLEGMDIPIDLWNNRPGKDAARLKQFEGDCEVVKDHIALYALSNLQDKIKVAGDVLIALHHAWEERHDED